MPSARAALLAVSALIAVGCAAVGSIRVERAGEPQSVATDFPLRVEHWAEPKVAVLRRQENLDAVAAGATGEFDRFVRLRHWVRAQWPVGDPDPYPPCNGVDILAMIRSGRTGGFCGQYSYLLADALKSFGWFSVRTVELENPQGEGHFAVEAWSNEHGRWVFLDPTYDIHYTDERGTPLNALELHEAWASGTTASIRAVEGNPPPAGRRVADLPNRGLEFFAKFAVATRSDTASRIEPISIAEREKTYLRWDDARGGAWKNLHFVLASARASDLYPAVAQVTARTEPAGESHLRVEFSTNGSAPHFMAYQVRLDGGEWKRTGAVLEWEVPPGEHRLDVAAVNVAGVSGPVFGLIARR